MRRVMMGLVWTTLVTPVLGCAVFGGDPHETRRQRLQASRNYNTETAGFKNANLKFKMTSDYLGMLKELMFGTQVRVPLTPLPEIKPDFMALAQGSDDVKFIWFGHSTFLVRIGNKSVLIDPVFGDYASPVPFIGKRFQPALVKAPDFPHIDMILISHDHYDHLEMETIQHFAMTDTHFVVPLGVGAHLERWGVKAEHLTELDWWEQSSAGGLNVICTPAQHFSGRSGLGSNNTLWSSWIIQDNTRKIFYSGDSGYSTHYKEIGDKYGPFDLTFLENGQYNKMWSDVHQMPEQTVAAHLDLKGGKMVPVHWGAYELAFHDWFEPAERVTVAALQRKVDMISPKLGELVDLSHPPQLEAWWRRISDMAKAE